MSALIIRKSVLLGVLLMGLISCTQGSKKGYVATIKDGLKKIPQAAQIEELLGESDHFITHYGFGEQPLHWHTRCYFRGGYELSMVVDVTIDYKTNTIIKVGEPKFYLEEFKKIILLGEGGMTGDGVPKNDRIFNKEQWSKIYNSKGDFSVLGLKVPKKQVEHFDKWKQSEKENMSLDNYK